MPSDPIQRIEKMVRDMHDGAGKYSQPVLRRYPLLFAFLVVFSSASIMQGFNNTLQDVEFIHTHPWFLMAVGCAVLFFTGMLYKSLGNK